MDKKIYLTCEEFCYPLVGDEFLEVAELNSVQQEEDTRILLHASHAANAGYCSVVNVSENTDVLVLCIAFSSQIASPVYQNARTQARTKVCSLLERCFMVLDKKTPRQKPPDINPQTKTPWTKTPLAKNPPRQNILFRNFITFVFRMSYGKEISIWFLAVKYVRHGSIK